MGYSLCEKKVLLSKVHTKVLSTITFSFILTSIRVLILILIKTPENFSMVSVSFKVIPLNCIVHCYVMHKRAKVENMVCFP